MDRIGQAFAEISAALEEHVSANGAIFACVRRPPRLLTRFPSPLIPCPVQKRERDEALRRETELAVQLDAERAASAQRESVLLAANDKLLARAEELSATVARLQAQVSPGSGRNGDWISSAKGDSQGP